MAFPTSAGFPSSSSGYWRGDLGVAGPAPQGVREMGAMTQGVGMQSAGTGIAVAGTTWHPTIVYLLGLIVAEMVVFGVIGRMLG